MPLDDQDLQKIAALLQPVTARILTTEEAAVYTKNFTEHGSLRAFYRWCRRFGVKSVTNGRYSRLNLERALEREERKARFRGKREAKKPGAAHKIAA